MTIKQDNPRIFSVWREIIKRGTDTSYFRQKKKYGRCYDGVTIGEDFRSFDIFLGWYKSQPGWDKGYQVDKDLLVKGNRVYTADNCVLLPKVINTMLTKSMSNSADDLPLGVVFFKPTNVYRARCRYVLDGTRRRWWGTSRKTPEEAFQDYKTFKEAEIKRQANIFKSEISERAYEALMNYVVEITD